MELAAYIVLVVLSLHSIVQDWAFCRVSGQRFKSSWFAYATCAFGVVAIVRYAV